jgi:hypothetical protein
MKLVIPRTRKNFNLNAGLIPKLAKKMNSETYIKPYMYFKMQNTA